MAVLRLLGQLIQRLVGRLMIVREERPDSWRVREVFNSRLVEEIRQFARRHGFERLGAWSERFAFQGFAIFREVWANAESGVYLTTTAEGYEFTTYFDDGMELITERPGSDLWPLDRSPLTVVYPTQGGVEASLRAHERRVRDRQLGRRALRTGSLAARLEQTRETYRSRMTLPSLLSDLGCLYIFHPAGLVLGSVGLGLVAEGGLPQDKPLAALLTALAWIALNGVCYFFSTLAPPDQDPLRDTDLLEEFRSSPSTLRPSGVEADAAQPCVARVAPSSVESEVQRLAQPPPPEACPTPPARPPIMVRLKADTSGTRCPYCHDGIHEAGVACAECLAQHHEDCWGLHTRCSTCASPNGVVDQDPTDSATPEATCCLFCHVASDEYTGFLAASRRWSAGARRSSAFGGCCAPWGSSPGTGFLAVSRRWSAAFGVGCCAPRVLDRPNAAPGPNRIVIRARATARPADPLQSPARLGAVPRNHPFGDEDSTGPRGTGSVAA